MLKTFCIFILKTCGIAILILAVFVLNALRTPHNFPKNVTFHIAKNVPLTEIAISLAERHLISSPTLFKVFVIISGGQKGVAAGDYLFTQPTNIYTIASRMVKGEQGLSRIKVTIPEGSTMEDIGLILLKKIPAINAPYFLKLAQGNEGYLFPDTYFFYSNTTADEVYTTLRKAFDIKMNSLVLKQATATTTTNANAKKRDPKDIVIMASIVEKEASSTVDRTIIASILWKRLDMGMLLQVDAPLVYVTHHAPLLTVDTKIDSPYNTYRYLGLPKAPISNPGLDALWTTMNATSTPYLYYLSDKKGNMHYAKTYDAHLKNKAKYIGR